MHLPMGVIFLFAAMFSLLPRVSFQSVGDMATPGLPTLVNSGCALTWKKKQRPQRSDSFQGETGALKCFVFAEADLWLVNSSSVI